MKGLTSMIFRDASREREIDAIASRWVIRRQAGLDAAEERELAEWMAADPAHQKAFQRLAAMSAVLARAEKKGTKDFILTQLAVRTRKRQQRRTAYAVAASVLAFLLAVALPRVSQDEPAAVVAQGGESVRQLPDGSIVEVKPGTELNVQFEPAIRRVELVRGEAFFRVESNPSRPFVVRAGGVDVYAVGTAFNVRLDTAGTAGIEVFVTEGKVGLDNTASGESLLPRFHDVAVPVLVAGQKAFIDAALSVRVVQLGADGLHELTWSGRRLEFDRMELAKAVDQMNRSNRVQIVIEDEAVKTLQISGSFLIDDPETFARLAATSVGLEIERHDDGRIFLRKR